MGGGGGSTSTGSSTAPTSNRRNPKREAIRSLAKFLASSNPSVVLAGQNAAPHVLRGLSPKEVQKATTLAKIPDEYARRIVKQARVLRDQEKKTGNGFDLNPLGVLPFAMKQASRPVQAVESGLAEVSRQGEANPIQLGPVSFRLGVTNPGEVLNATKEGFTLKRHDSPTSIAMEAGKTRAEQGVSTKSFGFVPGTDLAKGEALPGGKVGMIAYDVGGGIALDPLTYVTLGVGAAARIGLRATERILGAERAADVAANGLKVLDAEEKARLGESTVRALRGVRGGVSVRVPQPIRSLRGENLLAPPRTVIPGKYIGSDLFKAGLTKTLGTKGGEAFTELFVPRSQIRQAEREGRVPLGTADKVESLQATARGTGSSAHKLNVSYLRRVAKESKLTSDEAFDVAVALDTGDVSKLTERTLPAFEKVDAYRQYQSARLRDAGLLPEEGAVRADGSVRGIDDSAHYPHVPRISQESRTAGVEGPPVAMQGKVDVLSRTPTPSMADPGFSLRRTGGSLEEDLAKGRDWETNPFAAYAVRSREIEDALATHDMTRGLMALDGMDGRALMTTAEEAATKASEQLGRQVTVGELAKVLPEDQTVISVKNVGDFVVDKSLAPEMQKIVQLRRTDASAKFLKFLDRWMTLWKGYATVPLPFGFGFHMRNAASNVMLNWLADINPADPAYYQAMKLQRRLHGALKAGDWQLAGMSAADREIITRAMQNDIIQGGGFFIEDIPMDTLRKFRSRWGRVGEATNPINPNNLLIRSGRSLGQGVEENARLAHFLVKYREYGNFEDAASSVRRYLFDYGDLTPFEQNVMKRIIPFYTFTRKNTPLWLGAVVKQPGKYSRMFEWRQAFLDAAGRPNTEVTPDYYEAGAAVPLPFKLGGNTTLLAPDTPMGAASNAVQPLYESLKNIAAGKLPSPDPYFKAFGEQAGGGPVGFLKSGLEAYAFNKDLFTGRDFYPGQREAVPFPLNLLPGWQKGMVDGRPEPSIDVRTLHMLNNLLPLLPKVSAAVPTDASGKDKQTKRLISMLTGVQIAPLGPATKRSEWFRRAEELAQLGAKMRGEGKNVPAYFKSSGKKTSSGGGMVLPK